MGRKQNAILNIVPLGTKYDIRDSIFQTNPSPVRDQIWVENNTPNTPLCR